MKRFTTLLLLVLMLLPASMVLSAEQVRVYVSEFSVTGVQNRDELKPALQALVMSRLTASDVQTVDNQPIAHLVVKGSYIAFGKVFSVDLIAKDSSGRVVARAFQQGESESEMISAVAKASASLAEEISKKVDRTALTPLPDAAMTAASDRGAAADVVRPEQHSRVVSGDVVPAPRPPKTDPGLDIVRSSQASSQVKSGKVSKRIPMVMKSLAMGARKADGARELFILDGQGLKLCEFGSEFKIVDEVALGTDVTTLGVDTVDLDGDGNVEAYVTMLKGEKLASQVYVRKGDKLERIAVDLEYYFRALAFSGKQTKLYAQEMGRDRDYFGKVSEVVKSGGKYELKNPLNLPAKANIFNFTRITDQEGKELTLLFTDTGFLIVYGDDNKELWRSNDKFGGSETYFRRDDQQNIRFTGASTRMVFLDQRITVTPEGLIMVPQNEGTYVVGNSRDYKKHSVFAFIWNGSSLDEVWHTKPNQTYLADYLYDREKKELVLLEVTAKEGFREPGASALSIKKVE